MNNGINSGARPTSCDGLEIGTTGIDDSSLNNLTAQMRRMQPLIGGIEPPS
jgi:hypothetical protein